jgi:hypothetical protein
MDVAPDSPVRGRARQKGPRNVEVRFVQGSYTMAPWFKAAVVTAAVVLPGGLLLLPVLVADRIAARRRAASS